MASLVLMDAARMRRTLVRIAHEILERHPDVGSLAFVGIRSRGVPLARRLAALIADASGANPAVGACDITLYRDDFTTLAAQPITRGTDILFSIDARTVVLVDDVLFTGRTVRAALDQLIDFGRPARIELAVLVDRGHRELPIRADYVGRTLSTARNEAVEVRLREEDGVDEVALVRGAEGPAARRKRPTRPPASPALPKGAVKPAGRSSRAGRRPRPRTGRKRSRR